MYLHFIFKDGKCVDIDPMEFGDDGVGATLDHLAVKHGGVTFVELRAGIPVDAAAREA